MPCNSDYMNPNSREANSKKVAIHIVNLSERLGLPVEPRVKKAYDYYYGDAKYLDEMTKLLCAICQHTDPDIIYDGKDRNMRDLANWWEDHQEADQKRLEQEKAENKKEKMKQEAIDILKEKFSDKEIKELGL